MRPSPVAPLAWAGLLLSGAAGAALYWIPQWHADVYSLFSAQTAARFMPIVLGAVAAQAVAIVLLWLKIPGGMPLAFAGGAVLLPAGLVFMEGCMMTRQRARYVGFELDTHTPEEFGLLYPNISLENNPHIALGIALTGVLCYMLGVLSVIGTFLLVAAGILAIRAKRVKKRPILGLYDHYFVFTPNIWAETYAVAYRSVRGYLLKNKRIFLMVEDSDGRERQIVILLRRIHPEDRDDAASSLASRLALGTQLFGGDGYYG